MLLEMSMFSHSLRSTGYFFNDLRSLCAISTFTLRGTNISWCTDALRVLSKLFISYSRLSFWKVEMSVKLIITHFSSLKVKFMLLIKTVFGYPDCWPVFTSDSENIRYESSCWRGCSSHSTKLDCLIIWSSETRLELSRRFCTSSGMYWDRFICSMVFSPANLWKRGNFSMLSSNSGAFISWKLTFRRLALWELL